MALVSVSLGSFPTCGSSFQATYPFLCQLLLKCRGLLIPVWIGSTRKTSGLLARRECVFKTIEELMLTQTSPCRAISRFHNFPKAYKQTVTPNEGVWSSNARLRCLKLASSLSAFASDLHFACVDQGAQLYLLQKNPKGPDFVNKDNRDIVLWINDKRNTDEIMNRIPGALGNVSQGGYQQSAHQS
jgi:hypothetical protein